jgi:hypothetical protein
MFTNSGEYSIRLSLGKDEPEAGATVVIFRSFTNICFIFRLDVSKGDYCDLGVLKLLFQSQSDIFVPCSRTIWCFSGASSPNPPAPSIGHMQQVQIFDLYFGG